MTKIPELPDHVNFEEKILNETGLLGFQTPPITKIHRYRKKDSRLFLSRISVFADELTAKFCIFVMKK